MNNQEYLQSLVDQAHSEFSQYEAPLVEYCDKDSNLGWWLIFPDNDEREHLGKTVRQAENELDFYYGSSYSFS